MSWILKNLPRVDIRSYTSQVRRQPEFSEPMELAEKAPPPPNGTPLPSIFNVYLPEANRAIHKAAIDLHPLLNEFWRRIKNRNLELAALKQWQLKRERLERAILQDHLRKDLLSAYFTALLFERVFLRSLLSREVYRELAAFHDFKQRSQAAHLAGQHQNKNQLQRLEMSELLANPFYTVLHVPNHKKIDDEVFIQQKNIARRLEKSLESQNTFNWILKEFDSEKLFKHLEKIRMTKFEPNLSRRFANQRDFIHDFVSDTLLALKTSNSNAIDRISQFQAGVLHKLSKKQLKVLSDGGQLVLRSFRQSRDLEKTASQKNLTEEQPPDQSNLTIKVQEQITQEEFYRYRIDTPETSAWLSSKLQKIDSHQQNKSKTFGQENTAEHTRQFSIEKHEMLSETKVEEYITTDQKLILAASDYQSKVFLSQNLTSDQYKREENNPIDEIKPNKIIRKV